jgi:hypothetical protein
MVRGQQSPKRQTRTRNPNAIRRSNLRELEVPYFGGQQANVQERHSGARRRAGRQAWKPRVARYGLTGRRRRLPTPCVRPQVVATIGQRNQNNTPLYTRGQAPGISTARSISGPTTGHDHHTPLQRSLNTDRSDTEDETQTVEQFNAPQLSARTPLAEVVMMGAPDVLRPTSTGRLIPERTDIAEMTRLLDERRARLLGPQDLSRPQRSRLQPMACSETPQPAAGEGTFIIAEDDRTTDFLEEEVEEDKENARPAWDGRHPPPAQVLGGSHQPPKSRTIPERAQVRLCRS